MGDRPGLSSSLLWSSKGGVVGPLDLHDRCYKAKRACETTPPIVPVGFTVAARELAGPTPDLDKVMAVVILDNTLIWCHHF